VIKNAVRETGLLNDLCDHLRGIGVKATLLPPNSPEGIGPRKLSIFASGYVLGCVKVEGRNLDLIQVERNMSSPRSGSPTSLQTPGRLKYQYHYVVKGNIDGLENKLKAELAPSDTQKGDGKEAARSQWRKPGKISFSKFAPGLFFMALSLLAISTATRQTVPLPLLFIFIVLFTIGAGWVFVPLVQWRMSYKEAYLAQEMNNDNGIRNALLRSGLHGLAVKPDRKNQCVRITPMTGSMTKISIGPASIDAVGRKAFPTREAFDLYDKMAQLIRRIENKSP